jgi:hypothetical protein
MLGGEAQGQDRAHRQSTDEHLITALREALQRHLGTVVPVMPGGAGELIERAAVPGELGGVYGMAGAGQAVGDVAQLDGRPAQAVNEQEAGLAAVMVNAAIFCRRHCDAVGLH